MGTSPGRDAGRRDVETEGPAVVAYTTEDDQHPEVRLAAETHAREHGCVVILYAADAASAFSEPMPNQWASEGEGDQFSDRLSPDDLEVLGRAAIAEQVRSAGRRGVKTAAWLPKDKGVLALAEYAGAESAHILFVSEVIDALDELRAAVGGGDGARDGAGEAGRDSVQIEVVPDPSSSADGAIRSVSAD